MNPKFSNYLTTCAMPLTLAEKVQRAELFKQLAGIGPDSPREVIIAAEGDVMGDPSLMEALGVGGREFLAWFCADDHSIYNLSDSFDGDMLWVHKVIVNGDKMWPAPRTVVEFKKRPKLELVAPQ